MEFHGSRRTKGDARRIWRAHCRHLRFARRLGSDARLNLRVYDATAGQRSSSRKLAMRVSMDLPQFRWRSEAI